LFSPDDHRSRLDDNRVDSLIVCAVFSTIILSGLAVWVAYTDVDHFSFLEYGGAQAAILTALGGAKNLRDNWNNHDQNQQQPPVQGHKR
jgi:hypothetical protein